MLYNDTMQQSNGRHVAHRNLLQGNWIGCPRHFSSLFADYICVNDNFVCGAICCTVLTTGLAWVLPAPLSHLKGDTTYFMVKEEGLNCERTFFKLHTTLQVLMA